MDRLTALEWAAVIGLGASASVALNYSRIAMEKGYRMGMLFIRPPSALIVVCLLACLLVLIYAGVFGRWWDVIIAFVVGQSLLAVAMISMLKDKAQFLAVFGVPFFAILMAILLVGRIT